MLHWANKMRELNFGQLMELYSEGNLENAREFYPNLPENQQILAAEQSFHQYLRECFFKTSGARYALWVVDDDYRSALRIEPYREGLLLQALETKPDDRRKGYGYALMMQVLEYLRVRGYTSVYSHIAKKNKASLALHSKCGFQLISDSARLIDGTVTQNSCTMYMELKKSTDL